MTNVDGQTVAGNENIANEFNKLFCEIGAKLPYWELFFPNTKDSH